MSYTVLNSAWSSTLLSDPEVAGLFSADADLAAMLVFEAALAEAEAEAGVFLTGLAQQITRLLYTSDPADEEVCVYFGAPRILSKKTQ